MYRSLAVVPLLSTLLAAQDPAAQDNQNKDLWIQDFAKAKAQAKAEQKDLLVDFTGSDWCGWCIRLDNEVFSKPSFQTSAPKSFVLVKLDYPQNEELVTPEIRAQNEKLQGEYSIEGYPTILLMDAEGRVYGKAGYQQGGPDAYNEMLAEKHKTGVEFKKAMATAAQKQGEERAQALDAALGVLDEEVVGAYHFATMQEIVKLGSGELKGKYEARVKELEEARQVDQAAREIQELVMDDMRGGEGEQAIAKLDAVIKEPKTPVRHQMALFFKGMIIMDTSGDAKAAIAALEEAKKVKPDSPIAKRIDAVLPEIKKELEKGEDGK